MYHFRSNPPSRQVAPRPLYVSSRPPADPLRERVEGYLAETDMTPGAFGRAAAGRFSLVRQLRDGAAIDAATRASVALFLDRMEAAHA